MNNVNIQGQFSSIRKKNFVIDQKKKKSFSEQKQKALKASITITM